ncbi:hypothetical protein CSV80_06565 [Sporosarcina sp. P12(2017)]|nr:hypothetical protein CSV81_06710 [Sporosarcina sp. P10]PIC61347.1 hypothetical protein CSV80_06565 [Sporosarcina sp. P12(2017)]
MGIVMILLGIVIFLIGFLTPINDFYTLPIALIFIVFGFIRLINRKNDFFFVPTNANVYRIAC